MSKTWVFFKLRMLQLRYDKIALFFSYLFPVILLMGIGYPMEVADKATVMVHYSDSSNNPQTQQLVSQLDKHPLLSVSPFDSSSGSYQEALKSNQISHYLQLNPGSASTFDLFAGSSNEQQMQSKAIAAIVTELVNPAADQTSQTMVNQQVADSSVSSYIATLLPGLIGMTLLIIGLNGFGGVLITEAHEGLYKNIKTIDASPMAFIGGLLLSRMFICYTMALMMFGIGIGMFDMATDIDYLLLFVVLTLGCLSFLGLGLLITVLSPSVNAFTGIINFILMPFVVFSGVFFSTEAFPNWLQGIIQLIPLAQMVTSLKAVFFEQVSIVNIDQIALPLIGMLLWCVVTLSVSWKKFQW